MTITFQTIGDAKYGLFLSLIRQGLFYVPFILLLPRFFGVVGIYLSQPAADVHDFYRNFVKAIDGEEEQIVTHHQMMVDMKIMEAAFTSDRTGMPVDVELKF